MRDQLIRYIDLLFAGAPDAYEIKQEILQNTLDRYDDLISQGKSPEAAYRLAISGIGDINEILGGTSGNAQARPAAQPVAPDAKPVPVWKTVLRAIATALYILCPIPLFVLQNEAGLCGLLTFVAVATAMMVIAARKPGEADAPDAAQPSSPQQALRNSVRAVVWAVGLCVYFILSFATHAWYITWVIFPLTAAVQGLIIACMDLKEAQ